VNHGEPLTLANIEALDFTKGAGLVPAIIQDADSGAVLMLGYMNGAALRATLERGRVVFFSRSKQRLWEKGETSGNYLDLVAARTDCDRDAVLVSVRSPRPVCHLGTRSCFADMPASAADALVFLSHLERLIKRRIAERPDGSYTAQLAAAGARRIAQKVGEEGVELALAGVTESDDRVIAEAADLIYHILVLLRSRGLNLARVVAELAARHVQPPIP
jgi:phosphoribosyl-AMP cyclohydrolase / phosphoribosyl-ATP pyrophosphohydrolase